MTEPNYLRLYQIGDAYEQAVSALQESGGEWTPEVQAQLDAINEDWDTKAERVICAYKNMLANATAIRTEQEALARRAITEENGAEGLKAYLAREMKRLGRQQFEAPRGKMRFQRNSVPSVSVSSPSLEVGEEVPVRYQRVSITLDKKQVVDDWKAGTPLPEGIEVTVNSHLRIS